MASQVFINLPVADLHSSMKFYAGLGFTNNPQFSDENGKCMVWSETIFVMILTHEKFKTFTSKPIADAKNNIAGLFSLSLDSVDKMNEVAQGGVNAGGIEPVPMQDYGFMQQRTVEDPDGHTWELFYMDMSKFPQQ
jgi:predicted lactoylglutathione lyase